MISNTTCAMLPRAPTAHRDANSAHLCRRRLLPVIREKKRAKRRTSWAVVLYHCISSLLRAARAIVCHRVVARIHSPDCVNRQRANLLVVYAACSGKLTGSVHVRGHVRGHHLRRRADTPCRPTTGVMMIHDSSLTGTPLCDTLSCGVLVAKKGPAAREGDSEHVFKHVYPRCTCEKRSKDSITVFLVSASVYYAMSDANLKHV